MFFFGALKYFIVSIMNNKNSASYRAKYNTCKNSVNVFDDTDDDGELGEVEHLNNQLKQAKFNYVKTENSAQLKSNNKTLNLNKQIPPSAPQAVSRQSFSSSTSSSNTIGRENGPTQYQAYNQRQTQSLIQSFW